MMSCMLQTRCHADDVDVIITEAVYGDDLHGRRHRRDKGDIEVIAWAGQYRIGAGGLRRRP
jgi:hypothetical protein